MIRVYLSGDFMADGLRVAILNEYAGDIDTPPQRRILRLDTDGGRWEQVEPAVITEPTLTLPDEAARALLEELTRYYHGVEDTRALRRDYDAERGRVDALLAAVTDLATRINVR